MQTKLFCCAAGSFSAIKAGKDKFKPKPERLAAAKSFYNL